MNSHLLEQSELNYPLIVHCHLRWDGVWQRPQQFLSRLSKRHRILFVEGPTLVQSDEAPSFKLTPVKEYENVTVMQTFFPQARFAEGDWVDAERLRLLQAVVNGPLEGQFERPVQWFYDPMAAPAHMGKLDDRAVVYDCMDELSQFKFAPPEIISRERQLLARADVVFAGVSFDDQIDPELFAVLAEVGLDQLQCDKIWVLARNGDRKPHGNSRRPCVSL